MDLGRVCTVQCNIPRYLTLSSRVRNGNFWMNILLKKRHILPTDAKRRLKIESYSRKNPRKPLANTSQIEENPRGCCSFSPSFSSSEDGSIRGGTSDLLEPENWPSPLCSSSLIPFCCSSEFDTWIAAVSRFTSLPLVLEQPNHQTPAFLGNEGLALSTLKTKAIKIALTLKIWSVLLWMTYHQISSTVHLWKNRYNH